ncbi:hypothetical protein AWJ19_33375 [Paenibacillus sp. DMB5]|nr:hypothetical protein AWJ19_33375 [Paenibacillus sp. DMB5]
MIGPRRTVNSVSIRYMEIIDDVHEEKMSFIILDDIRVLFSEKFDFRISSYVVPKRFLQNRSYLLLSDFIVV